MLNCVGSHSTPTHPRGRKETMEADGLPGPIELRDVAKNIRKFPYRSESAGSPRMVACLNLSEDLFPWIGEMEAS